MGAAWIASWAVIYLTWDPVSPLQLWTIGLRFAFLGAVAAVVGAGAATIGGDADQVVRRALPATLTVAIADVVAFMAPDTISTMFFGGPSDPWMAAIWFVLLLVGWGLAAIIAALGALIGARLTSPRMDLRTGQG